MSAAKNPSRDPIRVFCANFPSQRDLTVVPSKFKSSIPWQEQFDRDSQLRISRESLEVLNIITSSTELTNELAQLAKAVLEFYSPSPIEKFCRSDSIAKALIETNLIEGDLDAVTHEVAESVRHWLKRADEQSRILLPELAGFRGKTDYVMINGSVRWGPVIRIPEPMSSLHVS
jgi:hypothetical protein